MVATGLGRYLQEFWHSGWRLDDLYDLLWVRPYQAICRSLRNEPIDLFYNLVVQFNIAMHQGLSETQTGRLRWYATSMVAGLILLLAIVLGAR
jgi:NADH-quinone oxidoreductase subunit L